jgi:hypothetical protein
MHISKHSLENQKKYYKQCESKWLTIKEEEKKMKHYWRRQN